MTDDEYKKFKTEFWEWFDGISQIEKKNSGISKRTWQKFSSITKFILRKMKKVIDKSFLICYTE